MLERNVEQGDEIFDRRRWRIPDFADEGSYFEQEILLPLAHLRNFGLVGQGSADSDLELVIGVFEFNPLLVQHGGGGVRAFGHCSADLDHTQPRMVRKTRANPGRLNLLQPSIFVINPT